MICLVSVKQVVAIRKIFHYNTNYKNLNINMKEDMK